MICLDLLLLSGMLYVTIGTNLSFFRKNSCFFFQFYESLVYVTGETSSSVLKVYPFSYHIAFCGLIVFYSDHEMNIPMNEKEAI